MAGHQRKLGHLARQSPRCGRASRSIPLSIPAPSAACSTPWYIDRTAQRCKSCGEIGFPNSQIELIIFHSVGGYTFRMAEAIAEGVCSLTDCKANLKQITEPPGADAVLLPKVDNRKSDFSDIPVARVKDLEDCDGLAIGTPVFWGNMSSATKYFLEQTMELWTLPPDPVKLPQSVLGKPATVFVAGGRGHANELAIQSVWTTLSIFGMTIVTVGLNVPEVTDLSEVRGWRLAVCRDLLTCPGQSPLCKRTRYRTSAGPNLGGGCACLARPAHRLGASIVPHNMQGPARFITLSHIPQKHRS